VTRKVYHIIVGPEISVSLPPYLLSTSTKNNEEIDLEYDEQNCNGSESCFVTITVLDPIRFREEHAYDTKAIQHNFNDNPDKHGYHSSSISLRYSKEKQNRKNHGENSYDHTSDEDRLFISIRPRHFNGAKAEYRHIPDDVEDADPS
jgi:hypothetical protein